MYISILVGVYPIKHTFPAVGGGEGVGMVTSTGAAVTSMKEGDWVVPARTGQLGEYNLSLSLPSTQKQS